MQWWSSRKHVRLKQSQPSPHIIIIVSLHALSSKQPRTDTSKPSIRLAPDTMHTVFIRLPAPFQTLQVPGCSGSTELSSLSLPFELDGSTYLRTPSSLALHPSTRLSSLCKTEDETSPIFLELGVRVRGGKGGFGSQLRAAGGRMSSGKNTNNDSCRDLNGRRLRTLAEAQK